MKLAASSCDIAQTTWLHVKTPTSTFSSTTACMQSTCRVYADLPFRFRRGQIHP